MYAGDLMTTDMTKWSRIAQKINTSIGGKIIWEGPACKHKWQSTLSEYKKIANFQCTTGSNSEECFNMSFQKKRELNLP